jgi:signal transduction histidine kinase
VAGNRRHADELFALVHDARNMVAALNLYCDLLEEPGVLTAGSQHYAGELRLIGGASQRLLDKLDKLETFGYRNEPDSGSLQPLSGRSDPSDLDPRDLDSRDLDRRDLDPRDVFDPLVPFDPFVRRHRRVAFSDSEPIESLAAELLANRSLLSALVGPAVTLGLTHSGGARPIAMSRDDLTRVLVNLARNAAEAMPTGGHLQIALEENPDGLCLSFTDNGPGIPQTALEAIFSPGYSTNVPLSREHDSELGRISVSGAESDPRAAWPVRHRGLGLSIVRSIVSAAGGTVWAANRSAGESLSATHTDRLSSCQETEPGAQKSEPIKDAVKDAVQDAVHGAVIVLDFPFPKRHPSP